MSRQNSHGQPQRLPHLREFLSDIEFPSSRGSPPSPQGFRQAAPQSSQTPYSLASGSSQAGLGQHLSPPSHSYPLAARGPTNAYAFPISPGPQHPPSAQFDTSGYSRPSQQPPAVHMQPGTGPTYQVLALGPTGNLNAVQTDSSRPIGIYRQDRRSTNPSFEPSGSSKRHVCHQCGAAFSRPSELTTHMHRHSGQKQFVCECGRAYATHSNLQRHKRARHAGPPGAVHRASEHSTSETESDGLAV